MERDYVIELVTDKLKLVRTEANYTQDKMADILGISKKTLVQIEKGRISCGWSTAIAVCALFRESSILTNEFGGDPLDTVELIAHDQVIYPKEKTLGGRVWWRVIEKNDTYVLQQNVLSMHFRILDADDHRVVSCMDEQTIRANWNLLNKEK
jgi:DNA-binding XRE family transcriptional regulator